MQKKLKPQLKAKGKYEIRIGLTYWFNSSGIRFVRKSSIWRGKYEEKAIKYEGRRW